MAKLSSPIEVPVVVDEDALFGSLAEALREAAERIDGRDDQVPITRHALRVFLSDEIDREVREIREGDPTSKYDLVARGRLAAFQYVGECLLGDCAPVEEETNDE